tara:strand:+ start:892 stop:1914 length:1023 start_codon:yes stop_codon:yes gene_type:complete
MYRTPPSPPPEYNYGDDYNTPRHLLPIQQNQIPLPYQPELPILDEYAGIAHHVHNVFANLEDNFEEIMEVLGGRTDLRLLGICSQQFMIGMDNFFLRLLVKFYRDPTIKAYSKGGLKSDDDLLNAEGMSNYEKIKSIELKLELATRYVLTVENTNNMFTWMQFVLRQPDGFQIHYLKCFIEDTYNAYDGPNDKYNISCPKGIYERVLFAISDACVLYCTQYRKKRKKQKTKNARQPTNGTRGGNKPESAFTKCDNPMYRKLIRLFKKEVPDMNDLTKEWSEIFDGDDESVGYSLTPQALKVNFINYLNKKFTMYGLNQITAITKRANELEEAGVFQNKTF